MAGRDPRPREDLIEFTKMQGLGNDFVVVEDLEGDLELPVEVVRRICDRHFGVGADGLIIVRDAPSGENGFHMHYHNADGSLAEMCGNGVRCFAAYLAEGGLVTESPFTVHTLGGARDVYFTLDDTGHMVEATVDMGEPTLAPADIPAEFEGEAVYRCPVETSLGTFDVTALSMGNPHAVIWVDDVDSAPVDTVGPLIETHAMFPEKTNVEFVELAGNDRLRVRVWERGVGETLACGTGACAAVVAAVLACETGREVLVELPGGRLEIRWATDEHVFMTGPAEAVFTGTIEL